MRKKERDQHIPGYSQASICFWRTKHNAAKTPGYRMQRKIPIDGDKAQLRVIDNGQIGCQARPFIWLEGD